MTHALRSALLAAAGAGLAALPLLAQTPPATPPKPTPQQERGAHAFLAYCAMCHGDGGAGDGPLAMQLKRRTGAAPVHLDDAARIERLGRAGLRKVIVLGGAHTGRSNLMPTWGGRLSPAVIADLVEFVMALPGQNPAIPSATIQKYLHAPPGVAAEGRHHFVLFCSACHGPLGKGDGFDADSMFARNKIRPRNLTDSSYIAKRTDQQLYATIALGGGHMGKSPFMPGWTYRLSPRQIKDLVSYVREISRTAPRP